MKSKCVSDATLARDLDVSVQQELLKTHGSSDGRGKQKRGKKQVHPLCGKKFKKDPGAIHLHSPMIDAVVMVSSDQSYSVNKAEASPSTTS